MFLKSVYIIIILLKKIKPIILIAAIPVIVIGIFSLSIITGVTGAKYAKKIEVKILTDSESDLKEIKVKRISFNNNKPDLSYYKKYWFTKKYAKGIVVELINPEVINEISIIISDKQFVFDRDKFKNDWKSEGKNEKGKLTFNSPDYIYYSKSRFNKFSGIINWPHDIIILKKSIIKSIIGFILLPFALIILLFMFFLLDFIIMKVPFSKPDSSKMILLIFVIILSFVFINSAGIHDVKKSWLEGWWMNAFVEDGFIKGYSTAGDNYPPLSFLLLGIVKIISDNLNINIYQVYKSFLLIFLVFTTFSFFYFTKNYYLSSLLHLFLSIASVSHGYMDVLFAPFIVLSFFALYKEKYVLFTIHFALASLMKYQPVIILPFIFLYIIKVSNINDIFKIDYKDLFRKIILPALLILLLCLGVFGIHFIVSFFKGMQHSVLSANALNFNWLLTYLFHIFEPSKYGGLTDFQNTAIDYIDSPFIIIPKLLFIFLFLFAVIQFIRIKNKTFKDLLIYSNLGFITYFIFNTGVHQNHLFLVVILFAILVYIDKNYFFDFILWSFIFNINILYFYGIDGKNLGFSRAFYGVDISVILSIIILILYFQFYLNNIIFVKRTIREKFYLSGG